MRDVSRRSPSSPARRPPCGTERGYAAHRRWDPPGTEPCEACKLAKRRYVQANHISAGRVSSITVPVEVLAALCMSADLPTLLAAEEVLGADVVAAAVVRLDQSQMRKGA